MALLSHATFGDPAHAESDAMRQAVAILDARKVDFEYDGEMSRMSRSIRPIAGCIRSAA